MSESVALDGLGCRLESLSKDVAPKQGPPAQILTLSSITIFSNRLQIKQVDQVSQYVGHSAPVYAHPMPPNQGNRAVQIIP